MIDDIKNEDSIEVVNSCLLVNGKPFVVETSDKISHVENDQLVTVFRGNMLNYWDKEEIIGYYA